MLYEDQIVSVTLAENAAVYGHIVAQAKKDRLAELNEEEASHLFLVASYCAAILFQGLKAEGTNIILEESPIRVHIIARKNNDGINFMWEPRPQDPGGLEDARERISDKIGTASPKEKAPAPQPMPRELRDEEERENYLIKQLIRIP